MQGDFFMELDEKYIEVYDSFINDYKLVEKAPQAKSLSQSSFRTPFCFRGRNREKQSVNNQGELPESERRQRDFQQPSQPPNIPPLSRPRPPELPRPPEPMRPQPPRPLPPPPPAGNRTTRLVRELYYKLGNLELLYSQLSASAPSQEESTQLSSYANETLILQNAMAEIYRTLTGRAINIPNRDFPLPVLTGEYCPDLTTTYNYLSNISTEILRLIRIVDINSINRQLIIISTTITNQLNGLNNIISLCI